MGVLGRLFDKKLVSDVRHFRKGNKLIVWSQRSGYKIRLPVKPDKRIAYLAGAIIGDGNISITQRKVSRYPRLILRIFNSSKPFLNHINEEFHKAFGINGTIVKKPDKNCYILTINKKLVVLYFLKIVGLKAGKKINLRIPPTIKNKNLLKYLIAGLFDTDGFFSKTFGIMMQGSNYDFLKELANLSEDYYGIKSRKMWKGYLRTKSGLKFRTQLQIRSESIVKFIKVVPLKHDKYGPVV